ncbi:alpha/beta hydrolase [Paludibacterium paludis]|uniref:Alpha/beta hydrolase n=1 Tax=Paludibacterium paludis TaxID=1225769 RepID=A0A918P4D3_9NEIS|nr:alpha/beta fold hydrolase [Paludibacterium paludis]GGY19167.1 alpha/beta hydrolase [Paludibacterium paludis]
MSPRLELLHEPAKGTKNDSPPLLFVHGAFCDASCWALRFMPWFARRGYDCWAVSLEGHGGSEGRHYLAAVSIDDYVKNLAATMRRIKTPPILIGHSMGGYVIRHYLSHHIPPAVVFLASVPPGGLASSSLRMLTHTPQMLMKLNLYQHGVYDPEFIEVKEMLFSRDAPDEAVEHLIRASQPESQRALMDMTLVHPLAIGLPPPVPALVLGAADDMLIPPADIVGTANLMDARAEILPHMGHMMMMDTRWESVAMRIHEWLEDGRFGHRRQRETASPPASAT